MKWSRYLEFLTVGLSILIFSTLWEGTIEAHGSSPAAIPFQTSAKLAILLSHNNSNADLYVLDENNMSIKLIAQKISAANPAQSPDHKRIAIAQIASDDDLQIVLMNADGSNRFPIYTIAQSRISHSNDPVIRTITWSPDGKQIAFDMVQFDVSYIYIVSTDGEFVETWGPLRNAFISKWLSNRDEIAYLREDVGCQAIYLRNVESLKDRFLAGCSDFDESNFYSLSTTGAPCSFPHIGIDAGTFLDYAWSANGQYMAVALDQTVVCERDIMVVTSDTDDIRALPYKAKLLTWLSDNQSIAYVEDSVNPALCIASINSSSNRCAPPMEDSVTQIMGLSSNANVIALVVSHNPQRGDGSQICVITVDNFDEHCLTGILSGTAFLIN